MLKNLLDSCFCWLAAKLGYYPVPTDMVKAAVSPDGWVTRYTIHKDLLKCAKLLEKAGIAVPAEFYTLHHARNYTNAFFCLLNCSANHESPEKYCEIMGAIFLVLE